VLLATCWLHANQPQQAQETLLALKKRLPQSKIKLVDREAKLFLSATRRRSTGCKISSAAHAPLFRRGNAMDDVSRRRKAQCPIKRRYAALEFQLEAADG